MAGSVRGARARRSEAIISDGEAIRRFLEDQGGWAPRYRRALARRLGVASLEVACLVQLALTGRMTTEELSLALVLPADETIVLIDRLVAGGRIERSGDRFGIAPPAFERLAAVAAPFVDELDAVFSGLSPHECATLGRFMEAIAEVNERHADEAARRAMTRPPPLRE